MLRYLTDTGVRANVQRYQTSFARHCYLVEDLQSLNISQIITVRGLGAGDLGLELQASELETTRPQS